MLVIDSFCLSLTSSWKANWGLCGQVDMYMVYVACSLVTEQQVSVTVEFNEWGAYILSLPLVHGTDNPGRFLYFHLLMLLVQLS